MNTRAEEILETAVLDEGGADAAAVLNEGRDANDRRRNHICRDPE